MAVAMCFVTGMEKVKANGLSWEQTDLFISGQNGYHTYRIPSIIVTSKGTLLAFCEGRKNGGGDSGDVDLVMRRSTDGGKSWSNLQVIWNDGLNTCGNPCPVVDRTTGTIWLLMTHNLGEDRESQIIEQKSKGARTVWVTKSIDDGLSWTPPQNITGTTKQANWTWYATGPGAGIQLKSGRLVIPCDHIEAVTKKAYSHIIYSDDHGATWRLGGTTPQDQVNECTVVQREDSSLLLNMRNYGNKQRNRALAISHDEGLSWSPHAYDAALIEPVCQASIYRFPAQGAGGRSAILFSNPASKEKRENLTIRLSYDEGNTWPVQRPIHPGPAAYSCLSVGVDLTVYCLYERGDKNPYEKITLARFPVEWLRERRP